MMGNSALPGKEAETLTTAENIYLIFMRLTMEIFSRVVQETRRHTRANAGVEITSCTVLAC